MYFCKIANGEIPSATLYEDEDFRVILDLGPASKGHALILPKAHAANIYEISDDMAAKSNDSGKEKWPQKMTEVFKSAMVLTLYKIMANRQDRLFFIFICI